VKGLPLLLRPRALWAHLAGADLSVRDLLLRYILPFAAIGPVAAAIGADRLGIEVHGAFFHPPLVKGVLAALGMWLANILIVLGLAQAIKGFAGVFDADQRYRQALKLAVFASLPGWIAGVVLFASGLWPVVAVVNIYGAYLIARGVGPVTGARKDCAVIYGTLIIAIFALLLGVGSVATIQMRRATLIPKVGEVPEGRLSARGIGSLDLSKAKEALRALHGQDGGTQAPPSSPEELQALLPSELASGFTRLEASNNTVSVGGFTGSTAEGLYALGDNRITLKVSDAGAAKGLIDAVTLKGGRSSDTGYEKRGMVDGRMTIEKYDRPSHTGEYAVVIAGRYIVQAKGRADVGTLKAAAQSIDWTRLEAMAKG
jgi:hypothetical protein